MVSVSRDPTQFLLKVLDRPETPCSLAYRFGLEARACQDWLEELVSRGVVARMGRDEWAVYWRTDD